MKGDVGSTDTNILTDRRSYVATIATAVLLVAGASLQERSSGTGQALRYMLRHIVRHGEDDVLTLQAGRQQRWQEKLWPCLAKLAVLLGAADKSRTAAEHKVVAYTR